MKEFTIQKEILQYKCKVIQYKQKLQIQNYSIQMIIYTMQVNIFLSIATFEMPYKKHIYFV